MQVTKTARALVALCWAVSSLACSRGEPDAGARVRQELAGRTLACPAPADVGRLCADVADTRACWLGPTAADVRRVERPLPKLHSERGFRCAGRGAERTCEDRRHASDLSVSGERAIQRHPRLPDDGEWECADLDGVVVCRGWAEAAGVVPAKPDPGWFCGTRAGAASERICVDFAPDRPGAEPWSCRFQHEPGVPSRECARGGPGPLGRACGDGCPFGSVCASDRCLPLEPRPTCWIDKDCGDGKKCAYGTCQEPPR